MAIFRPIDWDGNAGTGWFNTAYSGNMKNAGTAMFYGRSFESAGWLAVFKNTEKTTVTITKVHSIIGNRSNQSKVHAKVMCKPLGQNYTSKLASISIESKYTTSISNAIPRKNKLSSEDTVSVKLNTPIKVNSGEYFCVGFLGTDIPSGSYFNMALRRLTKNVTNIFYTQDSNTSKTVTWYRSGNANDNTNWKKHYAYIWAEGTVEQTANPNPPVVVEPSPPKLPCETSIGLTLTASNVVIPQGATTTIKVKPSVKTNKLDPTGLVKLPNWQLKTTKIDKFNISCSGDTITVETGRTSKDYSSNILSATIVVIAESGNNTGRTVEKSITIQATPPTINSLTVSKDSLRPGETASISSTYSDNTGGVTYSIASTDYATISGSTITAKSRSDTDTGKTLTVIATAKNCSDVTKTLTIAMNHWSRNDIQISRSSDSIFADSLYGDSNSTITVKNISKNSLAVNLALTDNTVLSFSNTKSSDTTSNLAYNTTATLYTYGGITANDSDIIRASLYCDTGIYKDYPVTLIALPSANINYPKAISSGTSISLPAIALVNSSGGYDVHFSTYPIYINFTNSNLHPVTVTLSNNLSGHTIKLGQAFNNSILNGLQILRPIGSIYHYNSLSDITTKSIQYTIKAYTPTSTFFEKTFTINYSIYREDIDLISAADKAVFFKDTKNKAERLLNAAQHILYEYDLTSADSIILPEYITDSKDILQAQLTNLLTLIKQISTKSASLVLLPEHRIEVAAGQYIMADDSVTTLANGQPNTFKSSNAYRTKTASPYKELVTAIKNLIGPVEHYSITYNDIPITKINGNPIDKLYL